MTLQNGQTKKYNLNNFRKGVDKKFLWKLAKNMKSKNSGLANKYDIQNQCYKKETSKNITRKDNNQILKRVQIGHDKHDKQIKQMTKTKLAL